MFKDTTNGTIKNHPKLLLCVDGGCEPKNPGGVATSGWVLYDSSNSALPLVEEGRIAQDGGALATNNYGEYCALGFALSWLKKQDWRGELAVKADSKLLVEQINGRWKVKAAHLATLRQKIWALMESLELQIVNESEPLPEIGKNACTVHWVPRDDNEYANDLCRAAYQEHKQSQVH